MPWITQAPDTRTPEERKLDEERAYISRAIPRGWATHFNRLTYGLEAADAAGDSPMYGVCGCRHVCLMAGSWRHPYPFTPACDEPPTTAHVGPW